jgi:hypothetical protein
MIRENLIEVIEDVLEAREEIINAAQVLLGMKNSIYGQEQIDMALSHLAIAVQIIGEPIKEEQS